MSLQKYLVRELTRTALSPTMAEFFDGYDTSSLPELDRQTNLINAKTLSGLRSLLRRQKIDDADYAHSLAGLRGIGLRRRVCGSR